MAIVHSSIAQAELLARMNRWLLSERWMLVLPLSLMIHGAGLWLLSGSLSVEYGMVARGKAAKPASNVLTVGFVASASSEPSKVLVPTETKPVVAVKESRALMRSEFDGFAKHGSADGDHQDYYPAGRLTRLPFPLTDIDLNVAEIDEVAFEGVIELTILVEVDGTVTHVDIASDHDGARQYADRVAARFQNARFSPGEIDGKAVRSKVQITVVSEPVAPSASTT